MLPSFEIENFRTFANLRIDHLGAVNLIVGRNNVGKTMLLEALRLYASGGNLATVVQMLADRDEWLPGRAPGREQGDYQRLAASLFHGRSLQVGATSGAVLRVGPQDSGDVRFRVGFVRRVVAEDKSGFVYDKISPTTTPPPDELAVFPTISVDIGGFPTHYVVLDFYLHAPGPMARIPERGRSAFVSALGVDAQTLARQWDAIAAYPTKEKEVLDSLGIVEAVERITTVERSTSSGERILLARIQGEATPVPLKSLGDGMLRILQLALALQAANPDQTAPNPPNEGHSSLESAPASPVPMLLVDEIENGVHYSVLPDVWRFAFRAARVHNVQVFATTHSWDCVEAFQQVAAEEKATEGMLIRLEKRGERHKVVTFTEEELAIVTRDRIEVR